MKALPVEDGFQLRPFEAMDALSLFLLVEANRLRLREWLPWLDYTKEEKDSLKFIEGAKVEFETGTSYVFGVWQGSKLAGVSSVQAINKSNRSACIGYWIGSDFLGKGLAKKATKALMQFAFADLKLNRIEIRCATGNVLSQRVPEALGFQFEGIARQCEWLYDHYVDHRVYAKLSSD